MNKRLVGASLSAVGLLLGATTVALANAGPVGLNNLMSEPGPGVGQVTLHWARYAGNVDNYSIAYGIKKGKYTYGVTDVGNNVVYTIGSLSPGVKYCFFLQGYAEGSALPALTPEICDTAAKRVHPIIGVSGPYGPRQLKATSGPVRGQVTLKWVSLSSTVSNYSIAYGTQPGVYQYGSLNVAPNSDAGEWHTFTVDALNPGQRYYFSVMPTKGDEGVGYTSAEVSQVAHR